MQSALNQFQISLHRVKDLISLHNSMKAQSTSALDLSDILRAALVLSVSALDFYIHEVVRIGMLEIFQGIRPQPPAFLRFQVSLESVHEALATTNNIAWLEDEIRNKHSYKSFQSPDKVADAIRLISDKKLWDEVSANLGIPARDIKIQLNLIVDRRNKIAHEADINPSLSIGDRWNITESDVDDVIAFIEDIVNAIHQIVT